MDFTDIPRLAIVAMFSDDVLLEQLVLKGGNALNLIHRLGSRSSLDLDLSIESDFEDFREIKTKLFRVLKERFASVGYQVFDEHFVRIPDAPGQEGKRCCGYQLNFKLIENTRYIAAEIEGTRRNSLVVGPQQKRVFTIQISSYEYCKGKMETALDDYTIYVYTPAMIAIEKLRAICQQMPEYTGRVHKRARARDFYDIHAILTQGGVDLATNENLELAQNIFAAKEVPLGLIPRIRDYREFHRLDWPAVQDSVSGHLESFDSYFDDFVTEKTHSLKALWVV